MMFHSCFILIQIPVILRHEKTASIVLVFLQNRGLHPRRRLCHAFYGGDEFWDMIAVVQSLPGVFAVNTALYVGHRVAGTRGAFAAMLGAIIPSITIILLVATVFREYRDQPVVERIFKGIRPCVVALILAPSLRMIKSAKVTWKTAIIPIATVFLIWWCKISPAYVILAAIAGSLIYALVIGRKTKDGGQKTKDGRRRTEDVPSPQSPVLSPKSSVPSPKSQVPSQEKKESKP